MLFAIVMMMMMIISSNVEWRFEVVTFKLGFTDLQVYRKKHSELQDMAGFPACT